MFVPTVPRSAASRSALSQMVSTFFGGSVTQTMAALLDISGPKLSQGELQRLAELIDRAKQEGR